MPTTKKPAKKPTRDAAAVITFRDAAAFEAWLAESAGRAAAGRR